MASLRSTLAIHAVILAGACGGEGGADGDGDGASAAETTAAASSSSGDATTTSGAGSTAGSDGTSTGGEAGWQIVFEADESLGALLSVWGPEAGHVYAVGGQQGAGGVSIGTMLVREAGAWSVAALPADTPKLNWIHGRDALRVTVGERGAILMRDGDDASTAWTLHGCATVLPLWGAWISAPDDVWTVGGDGFDRPPVLCHYDGAAWTNVALPALSVDAKALFKVFGVAADDVWAVGDAGLVLHYDGATWSEVELDTPADMISLWGIGPGELLAVGGRASGVLARYDGAAWTTAALDPAPGLNGVWMDGDGNAHVVSIQGTVATVAAGTLFAEFEPAPTNLTLHAVWSPGDGSFIAVGGSLELPPPLVGIIVEKN